MKHVHANRLLAVAVSCALLGASGASVAKRPAIAVEAAAELGTTDPKGRVAADGRRLALYQPDFRSEAKSARGAADAFLRQRGVELGLSQVGEETQYLSERQVGALRVVRYQQMYQGTPVRDAQIDVTVDASGATRFVANGFRPIRAAISGARRVEPDAARAAAVLGLASSKAPDFEQVQERWWVEQGIATRVMEVRLQVADVPGDWFVLVDAETGFVLAQENRAHSVDGTAMVFNPDPLSTSGQSYGGSYVDSSDADVAVLNAEREAVTLRDITFSGGMHTLVGPWTRCDDFEAPMGGANACPSQAGSDFSVGRASQVFEAANVYFHIDTAMRYYNETLGVTVRPSLNSGVVHFDPHGLSDADNSHYLGGSQKLAFGDGGVDDAEDADVIIHELGHGLHDWITGGGLSQVQGLSEGVGDYFASSYSRALGDWASNEAPYFWMFDWDGHNPFWGGRVTNYHLSVTYQTLPGGLHTPGQYWASCNLIAHDLLGRDKVDRANLLGLGLTNGSSSQQDAAQAVLTAMDANGYSYADQALTYDVYTQGGAINACTFVLTAPESPEQPLFADGFELVIR